MLENSLHVVVARFTVARPSATSSHLVHCVISSGNRNPTSLNLRERTAGKFNRAVRHVSSTSWRQQIDVLRGRMIKRRPWFQRHHSLFLLKTQIEPLRAPYSATGVGWGWKEGHWTKLYTWRLLPEAQPLNLLCTSFDRKGTPFMLYWYPFHAPSENTASLFTIVNATSFHVNKTPNQEDFSGGSRGAPRSHLLCTKANPVPRAVPSKNWWGGKRGKSPGDEVVPKWGPKGREKDFFKSCPAPPPYIRVWMNASSPPLIWRSGSATGVFVLFTD